MRALILTAAVLGVLAGTNAAHAGLSTTIREVSASVDPVTVSDEATQQTEDQIGLTKLTRREVQRRLVKLGFETKINGMFDDLTRASITRWQEEHGYPKTGYLNTAQHTALLNESVAAIETSKSENDDRADHRGVRAHHSRSAGGPIGAIGGLMSGLFGRR